MAKIYLLSEQTLKNNSILQDNVDMKVIMPTIYDVQNFYILPILGTSLYNDVLDKVANNTLTASYTTLLDDYITPTMIWYCRYELPMNMNYKYFNKSVGVQNSDNMNPASLEELQMIMDRAKNKAEWYAERLSNYLLAFPDLFPLYLNQTDVNIATIFSNRTNYTSGLVLDDAYCCKGSNNFQDIPTARPEIRKNCTFC